MCAHNLLVCWIDKNDWGMSWGLVEASTHVARSNWFVRRAFLVRPLSTLHLVPFLFHCFSSILRRRKIKSILTILHPRNVGRARQEPETSSTWAAAPVYWNNVPETVSFHPLILLSLSHHYFLDPIIQNH